ncbi:MAG: HTTM domain-containing protein [Kofleriaceae bacterium]
MIAKLSKWWFAPAPAERLAALRIAIGAYATIYVAARSGELIASAQLHRGSFAPVGVARILRAPLPPWLAIAIAAACVALMLAFTLGIAYRVVAPVAAVALLWTLTYRNAWGQVFHTEDLVVLHVLALACTPAADAWTLGRTRTTTNRGDPRDYGWAIRLLVALTAATYLLAGIAKLRLAGMAWLDGEQLRNQIAVDNARELLFGAAPSRLAVPLLAHPSWFTAFSVGTLVIELGAPLVFLHRRLAHAWAITAWAFHAGVLVLMHIVFPYPLLGFAFLPLFEPERIARRVAAGLARGMRRLRGSV